MKKRPKYYLLGEFLQKKRLESGLSQGTLAKKLGYSTAQFISNWERGISTAPYTVIDKLVNLLNIDKEEVVDLMTMDSRRGFEEKLKIRRTKKEA